MSDGDDPKHRKIPPASDEHKNVSGRKNTKKWCKGRVGREHKLKWVPYHELQHNKHLLNISLGRREQWRVLICTECKKEMDYCYPMSILPRPCRHKIPHD